MSTAVLSRPTELHQFLLPILCSSCVVRCAKKKVKRRGLLVASQQRACLLEVKTSELQAGQSKAYAFDVGPFDTDNDRSGNVGISSGSDASRSGDNSSGDSHSPDSKNVDSRESDTSSAGPAAEAAKVS